MKDYLEKITQELLKESYPIAYADDLEIYEQPTGIYVNCSHKPINPMIYHDCCKEAMNPTPLKMKYDTQKDFECPYCKKTSGDIIYPSSAIKKWNDYKKTNESDSRLYYDANPKTTINGLQEYYVCKNPEKEDGKGIIIINYQTQRKYIKGKVGYSIKYIGIACITVDEPTECYKFLKNEEVKADLFDTLHISSKITEQTFPFKYENAKSLYDFLDNNRKFFNFIGFSEFLKYYQLEVKYTTPTPSSLLLIYCYLYSQFPVVEILLKMGHTRLIYDAIEKCFAIKETMCSKFDVYERIQKLEDLLQHTTEGKLALAIPYYIGDYLKNKSAPYSEFIIWRDIYEYSKMNKNQFNDFINSKEYMWINVNGLLPIISEILKYGYNINKLAKYMYNYCVTDEKYYGFWWNTNRCFEELKDYLRMCDLLLVKPDLYPKDINKVHEEMSIQTEKFKNKMADIKFKKISDNITKAWKEELESRDEKGKPYETDYELVVPSCSRDFINEGNAQRNCVGSYIDSVNRGVNVIFFVRKKSNPEKAYITAEYRNGKLGQYYYRGNTYVSDKKEREFGEKVCQVISKLDKNRELYL